MKILVISDIHSNWHALAAIQERFDACLCIGDLVDYGTNPIPCIRWMREHATLTIRGNHDHAIAQRVPVKPGRGLRGLTASARPIHWRDLSLEELDWLGRLPVTSHVILGGKSFYLVHATPRDPMDEYLTADPEGWRQRLENLKADFVLVGHTHVPFHLDLGEIQVVNPGSVGQPRDGDPRCSYAVIENGKVSFRRVEYDITATLRQMEHAGLSREAMATASQILTSGRTDL